VLLKACLNGGRSKAVPDDRPARDNADLVAAARGLIEERER